MPYIEKDFVHLARLALEGRTEDVEALVRRVLRQIVQQNPDLALDAKRVLTQIAGNPVRNATSIPLPVDADSRLELLRREIVPHLASEPIWPKEIFSQLSAVLHERVRETELANAGIAPTRSMLFVGPPGVGKTLAAKWIAKKMNRPLLTLDLAAVMSSYLGRTGNNIRVVLDYARSTNCVLLLDEFDAIAKRRDDTSDVGELKRLVTVLLQAIDEWPSRGLLLAATNHPELLDPAVWRRFDRVIEFPKPSKEEIRKTIVNGLGEQVEQRFQDLIEVLAQLMSGSSFADVVRTLTLARRRAIVDDVSLEDSLQQLAIHLAAQMPTARKLKLVSLLEQRGMSQRCISEITGIARDTLRKHSRNS